MSEQVERGQQPALEQRQGGGEGSDGGYGESDGNMNDLGDGNMNDGGGGGDNDEGRRLTLIMTAADERATSG